MLAHYDTTGHSTICGNCVFISIKLYDDDVIIIIYMYFVFLIICFIASLCTYNFMYRIS